MTFGSTRGGGLIEADFRIGENFQLDSKPNPGNKRPKERRAPPSKENSKKNKLATHAELSGSRLKLGARRSQKLVPLPTKKPLVKSESLGKI